MPAIEVSHVTKEYRLGALQSLKQNLMNTGARLLGRKVEEPPLFKALDDVSFTVEQGEVVGIIGHNGAGKSTLLKMLARISTPSSGSVKVNGRIAPLIEVGAGFIPDFTGRENVYLNGAILGMSKREINRKFDEIVDFADMAEFIDTPVKRYSSGMQVKLAFAVATSVEAEILIVDEVLAVGDIAFQRKCLDRMGELIRREGRTVLLVSHNIRQIERVCRRVLLLNRGQVSLDGEPISVCERFFALSDGVARDARLRSREGTGVSVDTGQIRVNRLSIVDEDGNAIDHVQAGGDIVVVADFEARTDLINPAFSFGLQTPDLFHIAHCESFHAIQVPSVPRGRFSITCRILQPPLLPGVYSFRIAIGAGEPMNTAYMADDVLPFQVVSQSTNRQHALRQGVIACPSEWSLSETASQKGQTPPPQQQAATK